MECKSCEREMFENEKVGAAYCINHKCKDYGVVYPENHLASRQPIDVRLQHLTNWLYREARNFTEDVRFEQIMKGADKYPTPLGDADWTPEQLVHHAMQENVDQAHYLTMLKHEIKKLREENTMLKNQIYQIKSPS